jgi:hypothetical protein
MGCLVCGATPTVKSHIFPRALMLDLKGDGPHLHQGEENRQGTKYLQNGLWDSNILCCQHEQKTAAADEYGIEFCRNVKSQIPQSIAANWVNNSKPDLLVQFAYQNIWRFCASSKGRGLKALGPYAKKLQNHIFGNETSDFPILLARNHLKTIDNNESTIAIPPFPNKLGRWRFWMFSISGVQFYIKLDNQPFPESYKNFIVNNRQSVLLHKLDTMTDFNVPILQPLILNMISKNP